MPRLGELHQVRQKLYRMKQVNICGMDDLTAAEKLVTISLPTTPLYTAPAASPISELLSVI